MPYCLLKTDSVKKCLIFEELKKNDLVGKAADLNKNSLKIYEISEKSLGEAKNKLFFNRRIMGGSDALQRQFILSDNILKNLGAQELSVEQLNIEASMVSPSPPVMMPAQQPSADNDMKDEFDENEPVQNAAAGPSSPRAQQVTQKRKEYSVEEQHQRELSGYTEEQEKQKRQKEGDAAAENLGIDVDEENQEDQSQELVSTPQDDLTPAAQGKKGVKRERDGSAELNDELKDDDTLDDKQSLKKVKPAQESQKILHGYYLLSKDEEKITFRFIGNNPPKGELSENHQCYHVSWEGVKDFSQKWQNVFLTYEKNNVQKPGKKVNQKGTKALLEGLHVEFNVNDDVDIDKIYSDISSELNEFQPEQEKLGQGNQPGSSKVEEKKEEIRYPFFYLVKIKQQKEADITEIAAEDAEVMKKAIDDNGPIPNQKLYQLNNQEEKTHFDKQREAIKTINGGKDLYFKIANDKDLKQYEHRLVLGGKVAVTGVPLSKVIDEEESRQYLDLAQILGEKLPGNKARNVGMIVYKDNNGKKQLLVAMSGTFEQGLGPVSGQKRQYQPFFISTLRDKLTVANSKKINQIRTALGIDSIRLINEVSSAGIKEARDNEGSFRNPPGIEALQQGQHFGTAVRAGIGEPRFFGSYVDYQQENPGKNPDKEKLYFCSEPKLADAWSKLSRDRKIKSLIGEIHIKVKQGYPPEVHDSCDGCMKRCKRFEHLKARPDSPLRELELEKEQQQPPRHQQRFT